MSIQYYWHTLRHLKPIQFYARARFLLRSKKSVDSIQKIKVQQLRAPTGYWRCPVPSRSEMYGPYDFRFLNKPYSLPLIGGWDDPQIDKLWQYNLHYFDYLNSANAHLQIDWHSAILNRWIRENRSLGKVAWDSYPTSLRIVNWIKWALGGRSLSSEALNSLEIQAEYLTSHLEWHLLGNHLFVNAKALVFAGLYFTGPKSEGWLKVGLNIISKQLPEQVLGDGGNFERSTMYHALFLQDLLDLVNISGVFSGKVRADVLCVWRQTAAKMLAWLGKMSHPDGGISFFNDAAFGIAPSYEELNSYAERLGIGCANLDSLRANSLGKLKLVHFKESGYISLSSEDISAFLDVAPVGPDYLPGHAHADTLSFEASIYSHRVIVNGGTSCYGTSLTRRNERSTRSHSTVEVDGVSSSEVWGGFRVAQRAYPFNLQVCLNGEVAEVKCSHSGYKRLPGKVIHQRHWIFGEKYLVVNDLVEGVSRRAIAKFKLHPDIKINAIGNNQWSLLLPNNEEVKLIVTHGNGEVHEDSYAPEFGKILSTYSVSVMLENGKSSCKLIWR